MDYAQNGLPVYIKDYAIMPNEKYKIIFHVCNKNIIYDWVPDVRKVFAEIIITKNINPIFKIPNNSNLIKMIRFCKKPFHLKFV